MDTLILYGYVSVKFKQALNFNSKIRYKVQIRGI